MLLVTEESKKPQDADWRPNGTYPVILARPDDDPYEMASYVVASLAVDARRDESEIDRTDIYGIARDKPRKGTLLRYTIHEEDMSEYPQF